MDLRAWLKRAWAWLTWRRRYVYSIDRAITRDVGIVTIAYKDRQGVTRIVAQYYTVKERLDV